jgi:hypothetical protein
MSRGKNAVIDSREFFSGKEKRFDGRDDTEALIGDYPLDVTPPGH